MRDELPKDYAGTLKKVAALGYREVEAAGYYGHSAAGVKAAMADAGLRCVSAHYSMDLLSHTLDEIIAFHKVLGSSYILCWPIWFCLLLRSGWSCSRRRPGPPALRAAAPTP